MCNINIALVAFEHIITFDREIAVIWRRNYTGATLLFSLNRYCLLAYVILTIAPVDTKVCTCLGKEWRNINISHSSCELGLSSRGNEDLTM